LWLPINGQSQGAAAGQANRKPGGRNADVDSASMIDIDTAHARMKNLSVAPGSGIFHHDYYPGQERLFLKGKGHGNFQKWGENNKRKKRGLPYSSVNN
jgi:hypothetical protein